MDVQFAGGVADGDGGGQVLDSGFDIASALDFLRNRETAKLVLTCTMM